MVDRLTHFLACLVGAAALFPVYAMAGELSDPTRPPDSIVAPVAATGGATEKRSDGLQSIFISKSRRAAIIDGEAVELGGKHGDAKLIEVNEGSVVLQGAQGRQVLTLFPGVKMTEAGAPAKNVKNDPKLKTKPQSPKSEARKTKRAEGEK